MTHLFKFVRSFKPCDSALPVPQHEKADCAAEGSEDHLLQGLGEVGDRAHARVYLLEKPAVKACSQREVALQALGDNIGCNFVWREELA